MSHRTRIAVLVLAALAPLGVGVSSAHADDDPSCTLVSCPNPPTTPQPQPAPTAEPTPAPVTPVVTTPPDPDPEWHGTGHDTRPCVSKVEYQSAKAVTKAELEQRWDVTGLGRLLDVVGVGRVWAYPRCGYNRLDQAFYGAQFRNGLLYIAVDYKAPGATPHGRI